MGDALIERVDQTIEVVLAGGDATAALADAELSPLAVLASELRSCPSPAFKARLRANLERRTTMSMVLEKTTIREGFTTVTPYVRVREAGLLDFLTTVFGAVETSVTTTGGDSVHREVRVGDSMLMIGEGGAEGSLAFSPAAFHVYVPDVDAAFGGGSAPAKGGGGPMKPGFFPNLADCDAIYKEAGSAGATPLSPPVDQWYGDRVGSVQDAMGITWYIARPA